MEIVNIRIDERLIHGQVGAFWTKHLKANRILIIDDIAPTNKLEVMALKMATPKNVKLSILPIKYAIPRLIDEKYEGERVFIIVRDPRVLVELMNGHCKFDKVNIGNMSHKDGSKQFNRTVSLTERNIEDLTYLLSKGVEITAQMIPTEEAIDLSKILKNGEN